MKRLIYLTVFFFISYKPSANSPDTIQIAENVYLHVDRGMYTAGEDIWFKAYVIDPSRNKPSINTNNLHIELLNSEGEFVQSRTIRVFKGTSNGDFSIPDSISSGQYRIRAYTNHMRNYSEEKFFVKEITIVNPNKNDEPRSSFRKIENKITVTFFPEGGSLLDNVTSTIGFKAVDALGKGCDVNVKLYSSSGELMTIFKSTHLGMGFFNLKPLPGFKFYTVIQGPDGSEFKAQLPESFPRGVAIRTLITLDKNLILTVNTNEATLPSIIGKDLEVDISSRNLVNKSTKVRIDSLVNNYQIPLTDFPDGVLRITLGVPDGMPLCERLVFLQRNQDERLIITTNKKEYKPRERVTATISLMGDSLMGGGDFSISVAEKKLSEGSNEYSRSIASWFLLESDVKGPVEDPGYYFDPANEKRLQYLDILLMTQGWRDFKWKYDTTPSFRHETGFTLGGHVNKILNNNPVNGAKINAAFFHMNDTEVMETKTDKNGFFLFEELAFYGKVRAFLSSTGKLESMKGKISVDPGGYSPARADKLHEDSVAFETSQKDLASYRQETSIRLNDLNKYKLSDTIMIGEVTITAKKPETPVELKVKESRKFYSVPNKELVLPPSAENYGGDIFSYISGRIPGVSVFRGIDPENPFFPDDVKIFIRGQFSSKEFGSTELKKKIGALILLDGVEVNELNLSSLLMLPMNIVDRIDVLNASPEHGMRGANGVINIITKPGIKRDPVSLTPNSIYTSFQGFDIPRIFYSPKYDDPTELKATPDYRSTIFWGPEIKIDNKGKEVSFFNSDLKTTVNIIVEGLTESGIPLSCKTDYVIN
jgi:hypothetical protein